MAKKTTKRKTGASSSSATTKVPKASSKRTKRYTDEQKEEILQFMRAHDKAHKRGGQAAAVKKFGVTALTISKWKKEARKSPKKKAAETRTRAPQKTASTIGVESAPRLESPKTKLQRMLEVRREIDELMSEFAALKAAL